MPRAEARGLRWQTRQQKTLVLMAKHSQANSTNTRSGKEGEAEDSAGFGERVSLE